MASKLYEARVHKDGRQVGGVNPFCVVLDLRSPLVVSGRLNSHLLGAVLRDGAPRDEAHRFHMELRDTDEHGKGAGPVLFRWPLPAQEEDLR